MGREEDRATSAQSLYSGDTRQPSSSQYSSAYMADRHSTRVVLLARGSADRKQTAWAQTTISHPFPPTKTREGGRMEGSCSYALRISIDAPDPREKVRLVGHSSH